MICGVCLPKNKVEIAGCGFGFLGGVFSSFFFLPLNISCFFLTSYVLWTALDLCNCLSLPFHIFMICFYLRNRSVSRGGFWASRSFDFRKTPQSSVLPLFCHSLVIVPFVSPCCEEYHPQNNEFFFLSSL